MRSAASAAVNSPSLTCCPRAGVRERSAGRHSVGPEASAESGPAPLSPASRPSAAPRGRPNQSCRGHCRHGGRAHASLPCFRGTSGGVVETGAGRPRRPLHHLSCNSDGQERRNPRHASQSDLPESSVNRPHAVGTVVSEGGFARSDRSAPPSEAQRAALERHEAAKKASMILLRVPRGCLQSRSVT